MFGTSTWNFVAHGYNLNFENDFLRVRSQANGFVYPIRLFDRPYVDLYPVGIMMNGGKFKGSRLNDICGKTQNGLYCLEAYKRGDYKAVEDYIIDEAVEYIKLYKWLKLRMPGLRDKYQAHMAVKDEVL